MVLLVWMEMVGVKVIQWVVVCELYVDVGVLESYLYYYMVLKFEKCVCWLKVCKFLDDGYGIKVNFSFNYNMYYLVYKYIIKEDRDCVYLEGYLDFENIFLLRIENVIFGNKRKVVCSVRVFKKRKCGMFMYEVVQFIQVKNVKLWLQLMFIVVL